MSFKIRLYTHSKRNNSTKQPSVNGREFDCVIKRESGILHPMIELDIGLSEDPSAYNYAYIPAYNRYYYIEEWTNAYPLWNASLKVDALASWKSAIGNTDLYVLRASNEYDGNVIDTLYPAKVTNTEGYTVADNIWQLSLSDGCFIVGIVSQNGSYGSLTYYALRPQEITNLSTILLTDVVTQTNNFSEDDASFELQKSLIDPLSWIKYCEFVPIPWSAVNGSVGSVLNVFGFELDFQLNVIKKLTGQPVWTKSFDIDIPKHPQATTRGAYCNAEPYTSYKFFFPPFATFELDTTQLLGSTTLNCSARVDLTNGEAELYLRDGNVLVNYQRAKLGMDVQLSQVSHNVLGSQMNAFNTTMGTIGSLMSGNVAGAISSAVNGIANGIQARKPIQNSAGSNSGGFLNYTFKPTLFHQFMEIVDDDIDHNGRPLCKIRKPSALGGYMLIQDGDVAFTGTSAEIQEVKQYLESGFYYE